MVPRALPALALLFLVVGVAPAHGQWVTDGAAICTANGNQVSPTLISDGAGGAIVTWQDARSGNNDIYAQRFNRDGTPQWGANGVAVCTAGGDQLFFDSFANASQSFPALVSDGAGGAIITWYDSRSGNFDIYAQRVNASGVPQWTGNGVALCTAAGTQEWPTIASDGAGGAIITWEDQRSGNFDIYATRITASGAIASGWAPNGTSICVYGPDDQRVPAVVSDDAGGAIIIWTDWRSHGADVFAQRVNASGGALWTSNGIAVSNASDWQRAPVVLPDGSGGAFLTWEDHRYGSYDIFAQRITASGGVAAGWTANGTQVCVSAAPEARLPRLCLDGTGGVIISWYDWRTGRADPYAQRISGSGVPIWPDCGVALCANASDQISVVVAPDGAGGAIAVWEDSRNVSPPYYSTGQDIYAQHVDASGAPQWSTNGLAMDGKAICTASIHVRKVPMLISDGSGGALIVWHDGRSGSNDIYANRVTAAGVVAPPPDTPPTITCPANFALNKDQGYCSARVTFSVTAGGDPAPTVVCTPASGTRLPVGTTTVNCTATNIKGSASCSFTVTVIDNQAVTFNRARQKLYR